MSLQGYLFTSPCYSLVEHVDVHVILAALARRFVLILK